MLSWSFSLVILLVSVSLVSGGRNSVVDLTEDNWENILEGEWMIEL